MTLVDFNRRALELLQKNIQTLEPLPPNCSVQIIRQDLRKGLPRTLLSAGESCPFDLIFLDPPYSKGLSLKILEWLSNSTLVDNNTLVVAEERSSELLPEICGLLHITDRRTYGDTGFWLYTL